LLRVSLILLDGPDLDLGDERAMQMEFGEAFGKSADGLEIVFAEERANVLQALAGEDDIIGGKTQREDLRRLGRIIGQVGFARGEPVAKKLPGAKTDALQGCRPELKKSASAGVDAVLRRGFLAAILFQFFA